MSSDLLLVLGGAMSAFGLGWVLGRWVKTLRRFFDSVV